MKTLDRYIVRQFLINFAILFVIVMLLFIVIDLIVDLDEFLKAGERAATGRGGTLLATLGVIGNYYGPMIVLMYVFLSGLLVVGAAGFTLSALQRSREMVGIVAGGVSLYRVAVPILVAGIGLNVLSVPLQEFVIPDMAPQLARSKSQVKYGAVSRFNVMFAPDGQGNLLSASEFDSAEQTLIDATILLRDPTGMASEYITASRAQWEERGEVRGWRLVDGRLSRLEQQRGLGVALQEPRTGVTDVDFFATELSPAVLMARRARMTPALLSMEQLQSMQTNPAVGSVDRSQITRVIWSRFSMLVVNALVLIMGMVFFLQLGQTNLIAQALKAAAVGLGAWGTGLVLLNVDVGLLNPVATAWLPVVLFLPLTAALLHVVRT